MQKQLLWSVFLPLLFGVLEPGKGIFSDCQQLVVVMPANSNSVKAKLWKFEKQGKKWRQIGQAHPVNLGAKGIAWGRGLHSAKPGRQKKEGDKRSPAGIFRFGTAFGYAPVGALPLRIDYQSIDESNLCIEDSKSRYYNQIINIKDAPQDWIGREPMLRNDEQYKWGIFVKQNLPPQDQGGSCIFFHLWRAPGSGTLGCTAMDEPNLLALMRWLDPQKKPLLMQMTAANYKAYQRSFGLPGLW